jgi:hypothetical protein
MAQRRLEILKNMGHEGSELSALKNQINRFNRVTDTQIKDFEEAN